MVLTEFCPQRTIFAGMNRMKPGRVVLGKEKNFEQKHAKTAKEEMVLPAALTLWS
jgi:hypothetical protein